jgi:hypothetical protein
MADPAAVEALVSGYARGVKRALRAERPDLSWEVKVGPVDRAKLARLEAGRDKEES